MRVRVKGRRRWISASVAGLMVAGVAWAQVSSSSTLPPASAVPVVPTAVPVPKMAPVVMPPCTACVPKPGSVAMPPLVVSLPTPPAPKVTFKPIPVEEPKVPAVPAVRITPLDNETRVETTPVPSPVETAVPKNEVPPVVIEPVAVAPMTLAPAKPAKPAMAEIIAVGPKSVDATVAFQLALGEAKAAMSKVRDYSGHIILQERVKGILQPEQTAEMRVRAQPRSVALRYIAPTATVGKELVFVDGRNGNKARVKQAGTYGPLAFASVTVSDTKAAVMARHSLVDTGLAAVIDRVERTLSTEMKLRNPVSITAADFTFANKAVIRYEITCDRPHALRDAARMVVCIDPDTRMPVRLEVFDGPTTGRGEWELREAVSFVNLAFNTGLGDGAFEK